LKPTAFNYHRPESIDSVLALLDRYAGNARIIAGGQSLAPALNMRLAQPVHLIDVNDLDEIGLIREVDGHLEIGALARHRDIEHSPLVRQRCPLLAHCAQTIGHYAIRSRGTIGGSLAQADPAAQFVLAGLALDAKLMLISQGGSRMVVARDFITGPMSTCIAPNELICTVLVPAQGDSERWAYQAFCRRRGDYAIVAVAVTITVSNARIARLRIAVSGAAESTIRLHAIEDQLAGQPLEADTPTRIAALCAAGVEPIGSDDASPDYRRALVRALVERALQRTLGDSGGDLH
jgi:carbon-monoxide dehydrogenase medium subunit